MKINRILLKTKDCSLEISTEDAQALMFSLEELFRVRGEQLSIEGQPKRDTWVYFPAISPLGNNAMVVKNVDSYFENSFIRDASF